jgi:hypothetical protein
MSVQSIRRVPTLTEGAEGRAGIAGREPMVTDALSRLRLGSALRACQVASEACGRAIPDLSSLEDGRVRALTDGLELSELCAQALGRALEGSVSPFLEDELTLCAKVARVAVEAVAGEPSLEPCQRACAACADACDRVLTARSAGRSAA